MNIIIKSAVTIKTEQSTNKSTLTQNYRRNKTKKETCIKKLEIHKLTVAVPVHAENGQIHKCNTKSFQTICEPRLPTSISYIH